MAKARKQTAKPKKKTKAKPAKAKPAKGVKAKPAKGKPAKGAKAKPAKGKPAKAKAAKGVKAKPAKPAKPAKGVKAKPAKATPAKAIEQPVDDRFPSTCSGGGPVIAIPGELAASWRGTSPPIGADVPAGWTWGSSGGPVCDYDRICDVDYPIRTEYGGVGLLPLGDGQAIALDAELVTSWIDQPDGGVIWRGGSGQRAEGTAKLAEATTWEELGSITLQNGDVHMFDSAYPGTADASENRSSDGVAVGVPGPGTYTISVARVGGQDFIRLRR